MVSYPLQSELSLETPLKAPCLVLGPFLYLLEDYRFNQGKSIADDITSYRQPLHYQTLTHNIRVNSFYMHKDRPSYSARPYPNARLISVEPTSYLKYKIKAPWTRHLKKYPLYERKQRSKRRKALSWGRDSEYHTLYVFLKMDVLVAQYADEHCAWVQPDTKKRKGWLYTFRSLHEEASFLAALRTGELPLQGLGTVVELIY